MVDSRGQSSVLRPYVATEEWMDLEREEPRSDAPGAQEGAQRPWWRR